MGSATGLRSMPALCVFFDIGDVFVNTTPIIEESVRIASGEVVEKYRCAEAVDLRKAYLEADRQARDMHINHLFGDRRIVERALRAIDLVPDIRMVATFLTVYRDSVRSSIVQDPELLQFRLWMDERSRVYRFGVVSDGTEIEQLEILVRLGLIEYLDPSIILISEAVGVDKSGRQIYDIARARAGGEEHTKLVMVGDHPVRDIKVSQEAGFFPIRVNRFAESASYTRANSVQAPAAGGLQSLSLLLDSLGEKPVTDVE